MEGLLKTILIGNMKKEHKGYSLVHVKDGRVTKGSSGNIKNDWWLVYNAKTVKDYKVDCISGQILARHKQQSVIPFDGISTIDAIDVI